MIGVKLSGILNTTILTLSPNGVKSIACIKAIASKYDFGADVTPPTITSASPSGTYAEMVPISGTLLANEVVSWSKSGTDASRVTLNSNGAWSLETTDYETKTSYSWTFTATDLVGLTTSQVITITITDVDEIAPTLSSPTDTGSGTTTATLGVSTNEANGTLYWFVSASATPPTVAALKAGTGAVKFGNKAVTAAGAQSVSVTGLTSNTTYYSYFLHRDAAGNDSIIAAADGFTTTVPGNTNYRFGSDTASGEGGIPVPAGATLTSGNTAGHFVITSGYLVPTSTGATAKLNLSPYVLGFSDGSTWTITIDANCRDIRTQAEWDAFKVLLTAASAATWANKKVFFRPDSFRGGASIVTGIDGTANILKAADFGGFAIEGRVPAINYAAFPPARVADPCTVDKFYFRNTKNVAVRKLATTRVPECKFQLRGSTGDYVSNIVIEQNHIGGIIADPQGNYAVSTDYPNYGNGTYYFIDCTGSNNNCVGGMTVQDNVLEWGNFGVNIGVDRPGDTTINCNGNFANYLYCDCFHFSSGAGDQLVTINFNDNIGMNPMGLGTDTGNPHKDFCQYQGSSTQTADVIINSDRCRMIAGDARGGTMQGYFIAGLTSGTAFAIVTITGFLYVGDNQNAVAIYTAKNCTLRDITCVTKVNTPNSSNNITIEVGTSFSSGAHTIERCVADFITLGSGVTELNNVRLGHQGSIIPYANAFVGPSFSTPSTTIVEAMSRYAPKPGGPLDLAGTYDAGAVGGAVTWATTIPGHDGITNDNGAVTISKTIDRTTTTIDNTTLTIDRA